MSLNFFEPKCQEPPISHVLFGLCDDKKGGKAYSNIDDPHKWVATVKNNNKKDLLFIAVDKCVIKDNEQPGRGRCDALLISDEHIFFIELKDQASNWINDSIAQLASTIELFMECHNIKVYKHKKAFACNKRHTPFHEIDNETNLSFFRKYKVRIDVQAEIIVI